MLSVRDSNSYYTNDIDPNDLEEIFSIVSFRNTENKHKQIFPTEKKTVKTPIPGLEPGSLGDSLNIAER